MSKWINACTHTYVSITLMFLRADIMSSAECGVYCQNVYRTEKKKVYRTEWILYSTRVAA